MKAEKFVANIMWGLFFAAIVVNEKWSLSTKFFNIGLVLFFMLIGIAIAEVHSDQTKKDKE